MPGTAEHPPQVGLTASSAARLAQPDVRTLHAECGSPTLGPNTQSTIIVEIQGARVDPLSRTIGPRNRNGDHLPQECTVGDIVPPDGGKASRPETIEHGFEPRQGRGQQLVAPRERVVSQLSGHVDTG
jgi:hypothetical protein